MFRFTERKALKRRAVDIWYQGFAAGYKEGHDDTLEFFSERLIAEIHQDAVLSMTADIDTLERIVEIIEAVRDDGQTQHDQDQD
jgi:hypothetical protein